jgi:hypothetical protein
MKDIILIGISYDFNSCNLICYSSLEVLKGHRTLDILMLTMVVVSIYKVETNFLYTQYLSSIPTNELTNTQLEDLLLGIILNS